MTSLKDNIKGRFLFLYLSSKNNTDEKPFSRFNIPYYFKLF